jgi:predicted nucleic acid-binding protein
MIACFDTNVHIEILRGRLRADAALDAVSGGPVRLSPIVASELLRGARGRATRAVERLIDQLAPLEPPSWRGAWLQAGRILPRVFERHEEVGLGRLQNDVLLALTARHTGVVVVTGDAHFATIRRHVPFALVTLAL